MSKMVRVYNLLATPALENQAVMLGFVPYGHVSLEGLNTVACYKYPVDTKHEVFINVYSAEPLTDYMYEAVRDYISHAPFMANIPKYEG